MSVSGSGTVVARFPRGSVVMRGQRDESDSPQTPRSIPGLGKSRENFNVPCTPSRFTLKQGLEEIYISNNRIIHHRLVRFLAQQENSFSIKNFLKQNWHVKAVAYKSSSPKFTKALFVSFLLKNWPAHIKKFNHFIICLLHGSLSEARIKQIRVIIADTNLKISSNHECGDVAADLTRKNQWERKTTPQHMKRHGFSTNIGAFFFRCRDSDMPGRVPADTNSTI
ncbi:hypothetical protein V6N11_081350 [Hibiscus sabdariffa]|uniref:Uncharacterized protein n=1 Tax=Hibiscus sabdariffa TaxID=183260 RepID=A0ABR2QJK9_9ROSI